MTNFIEILHLSSITIVIWVVKLFFGTESDLTGSWETSRTNRTARRNLYAFLHSLSFLLFDKIKCYEALGSLLNVWSTCAWTDIICDFFVDNEITTEDTRCTSRKDQGLVPLFKPGLWLSFRTKLQC